MNEYGFKRLNNAAIGRSDLFVERFIEGKTDLPPVDEFRRMLDIPADDPKGVMRYLIENYRDLAGMTEIDPSLPTLITNLRHAKIDVMLLDNLTDVATQMLIWKVDEHQYKFNFPFDFAGPNSTLRQSASYDPLLSTKKSVENWSRIIEYLREIQPETKIIFSVAHSCTSQNAPDRAMRAEHFYELFKPIAERMNVQLIPPLNLVPELTKGPDDWAHFDMKVYRALAGYIYTSLVSGWSAPPPPRDQSLTSAPSATSARLPAWVAPPALLPTIARVLGIAIDRVDEESRMDSTENWDSLRQVEVMTEIEKSFGITVTFDETMQTNSIGQIRSLIAKHGIVAADDKLKSENIFGRFVQRARQYPDVRFMKFVSAGVESDITHGDMLSHVAALQDQLKIVRQEGIVAIILDHSVHLYSAFIGCVLGCHVPTILPPLTRKQDPEVFKHSIDVLFDRVRPAAVITSQALAGLVPSTSACKIILVDEIEPTSYADARATFDGFKYTVEKGRLAFLQHSSGTTGHKKGVMLTHDQVYEQVRLYSASIRILTGDPICSWLPLYHDMGLLTSFVTPVMVGCPIISMDALEWVTQPTSLLDQIERERAAFAWLPNFAFHHILKSVRAGQNWDLHSLKAVISCSEPCRTTSFERFAERFGAMGCSLEKLQTSYAMAENVFAVTQSTMGQVVRAGEGDSSPYLSSGTPLPGVEIQIRQNGALVEEGEAGEIWIRSTSMFSGYYNLDALTSERVVDGWYATRDLGRMSDGELLVKGRVDDIIIISGKNVVAHELEDELNSVPGIAPGRVLVGSKFDEASASEEMFILAEPLDEDGPHRDLEIGIREKAFSLCGVAPRRVRILQKGFLIKSTSGKISRSASVSKFQESEGDAMTSR